MRTAVRFRSAARAAPRVPRTPMVSPRSSAAAGVHPGGHATRRGPAVCVAPPRRRGPLTVTPLDRAAVPAGRLLRGRSATPSPNASGTQRRFSSPSRPARSRYPGYLRRRRRQQPLGGPPTRPPPRRRRRPSRARSTARSRRVTCRRSRARRSPTRARSPSPSARTSLARCSRCWRCLARSRSTCRASSPSRPRGRCACEWRRRGSMGCAQAGAGCFTAPSHTPAHQPATPPSPRRPTTLPLHPPSCLLLLQEPQL
jgi:hypothetical protein